MYNRLQAFVSPKLIFSSFISFSIIQYLFIISYISSKNKNFHLISQKGKDITIFHLKFHFFSQEKNQEYKSSSFSFCLFILSNEILFFVIISHRYHSVVICSISLKKFISFIYLAF